MPERIIYHNPDHIEHKGYTDNEGKQWDVPERLFPVVDTLLSDDTIRTEWLVIPEFHKETLDLIARAHSTEMIEAISQASSEATHDKPTKTRFDKDTGTNASAIYPGTFEQALMSAECAVSAADALVSKQSDLVITISRPPGHHAGREFYHGFCYFNLAAVAAEAMKESGKRVAILDFDIHHGDGTQDIFYDDPNVLYASLHADPNIVMPGTGHAHETGNSDNMVNIPLPIGVDPETYMSLLDEANRRIVDFEPDYLIIEAGFDGHTNEFPDLPPITQLGDAQYHEIGKRIGNIKIPSLVIFGGGYNQEVTSSAFLSYIQGMEVGRSVRSEIDIYTSDGTLPY
jgi:acetoin utilization deacetylase AcuC-like enzyme